MITKERLEELIEQGATIYTTKYSYSDCGIKLDNKHFEVNEEYLIFTYKVYEILLDELFETKEEAEWIIEFGCIERTERLELPTWEEFIDQEEFGFYQKYGRKYTVIRVLETKYLVVETNFERYYTGDLTKENYSLACRKAKELFLGEKK